MAIWSKNKTSNTEVGKVGRSYVAVYKCPLCGRLLQYGVPQEVPYDSLPELCARVIKNQAFLGGPLYSAPMQIPCKCPDGSCGMAAFAGFKVV